MRVWIAATRRGAVVVSSILLITTITAGRCRGEVLLNEVLYDPAGSDGGSEFVELHNPGPVGVSLAGARLEFANGAEPLRWQVRWTGAPSDSLAAGDFWLIVDEGWAGAVVGDAEVPLGLQNGPDAVRLLRPDGTDDRLGYGDLGATGFAEGSPHAGAGGGRSLGRRPDGADSDDNAADWVAVKVPTPGVANFRLFDVEIVEARFDPPSLAAPGAPVTTCFLLRNCGLEGWTGGEAVLAFGDMDEFLATPLPLLAADSTATISFTCSPMRSGRFDVTLSAGADAAPPRPVHAGAFHVGDFEIYLNEVMFAPSAGGEWFEVGNAGFEALDTGSWNIRDEDGNWLALPEYSLGNGGLLVIAQDAVEFDTWWTQVVASGGAAGGCAAPVVRELPAGWPTLNNTPPGSRDYADRLYLADAAGVVRDHVDMAGTDVLPAGRSFERRGVDGGVDPRDDWRPATNAVGATPGFANSVSSLAPTGVDLDLEPNPFQPGGAADRSVLHIRFVLDEACPAWQGEVYDLWGRRVRDLGGDRLGAGGREVLWDGCDDEGLPLSPGGYIVLIRTFDEAITPCCGTKRLAVLAGEWSR